MKKHFSLILLFSCLLLHAFSQSRSLSVSVDRQKILIGEPFTVTLQTTVPNGREAKWITVDTPFHFEILGTSKLDTAQVGNGITLKQSLTLTSWDSGRWQLPPFGAATAKGAKPIYIDVSFSPFDHNQDYHGIKDILEVQKPAKTTWYWYLIGAALLLLLFALLFPRQKKEPKVVTAPPVDAYRQALAQLETLGKSNDADVKVFYTELVNIFRHYVQRRKGIHSFQKTTDDISKQLKGVALPAADYNELVQVLQLSDFVKFARYQPTTGENENALEQIKKSIITIENLK